MHKVILDTAKNLHSLPDLEGGGKKKPSSAVNPLIKPRAKKNYTKSKSKSKVVDLEKLTVKIWCKPSLILKKLDKKA